MIAMLLANAEPSAEALKLGRQLAERGTLAVLLSVGEQKDSKEFMERDPNLSATDRDALKATVASVYASARERLFSADARSFATHLSVEDMRTLVAQSDTPASQHLRAALPSIIASTVLSVGNIDLGQQIRTTFCKGRSDLPKVCPPN